MQVYHESDAPLEALRQKKVAVLGFGAQGHAHALNLRDSGIQVIVAVRPGSPTAARASALGFERVSIPIAVKSGDLVIMALPDEVQPEVYEAQIAPHLSAGKALGFIHGFNVRFQTIAPPQDVDVIMVSPKGPGYQLRSEFEQGRGLAGFLAVHQEATGQARQIALAWARGIGCARGGIFQTTFKDETEADLFGEQAVLCGGVPALMKAGFETLLEAGYPPEIAYFECVHEVKLIVDLICKGGMAFMLDQISNTAEYGALTRGPRIVTEQTRAEMRKILSEIQSGQFAREWRHEYRHGMKKFRMLEEQVKSGPIDAVHAKIIQ
jgi:ketol-acid reductoisomerase